MLRLSAILLALTATAASAGESLESRVRTAAVAACAPEAAPLKPAFHYGVITKRCIDRISNSAMVKYQATAETRMKASTAAIN